MTVLRGSWAGAFGPARQAASQRAGLARVVGVVSIALVTLGLFTASWDRLANIALGGYNVKIPALAFSVAALLGLPALWSRRSALQHGWSRIVLGLVGALVLVLLLATALAREPVAGLAQVVAIGTGAIAPATAVITVVRSKTDLTWALGWFVAGAAFAGLFGVYQLVAFYVGWPQLVDYTGVGVGGGAGRIAAFSYEPAYFANFMIIAFGAAAARAVLSGRVLGWLPVFGFAAILVLVNVRALYFLIPAAVILLALRWRQNRLVLLRIAVCGIVAFGVNTGVTQLVSHLSDQSAAQGPVSGSGTTGPRPAPGASASADADPGPAPGSAPSTVLDPNEQSSNAPRLALYGATLEVVAAHPILGVGPGNLAGALREVGYIAPNQGSQVVANNIWLQALADGGIVLLILELALTVLLVVALFKKAFAPLQPLIAALLAVLAVSGMLTSYFFDLKIWVALGLIAAGGVLLTGRGITPERTPAAR